MKSISLSEVISIAKKMAQKYASTGIKNIVVSPDGSSINIILGDDSVSTLDTNAFMLKGQYDVDRNGAVDNSQRLGGELASWYTDRLDNLDVDVEFMNDTIHSIIGGQYITDIANALVKVLKYENGVVIDDSALTTQLNLINNTLTTMASLEDDINTKLNNTIKGDYTFSVGTTRVTLVKENDKITFNFDVLEQNLLGIEDDLSSIATTLYNQEMTNMHFTNRLDSTEDTVASNSEAILNLISGQYMSTNGTILSLTKYPSGVIIDQTTLASQINALNTSLLNIQLELAKPKRLTSYLTSTNDSIVDTVLSTNFRQRCALKTDGRYPTTAVTSTFSLSNATNTLIPVNSSISDAGVWDGTYSNVLAICNMFCSSTVDCRFKAIYFKRTSAGVETVIGESNNVYKSSNSNILSNVIFNTVLNDFSMTSADRMVIRLYATKVTQNATFTISIGGSNPTYHIFEL